MILQPTSLRRHTSKIGSVVRLFWAVGLVVIVGMVLIRLNARPLSLLLGYAVAVFLAAFISGRQGALCAIFVATIMGAWTLPPSNSIYIAPTYRLGYGIFLVLCVLITFFHPPRSSVPPEQKADLSDRDDKPYTEADLPTLAPTTRGDLEQRQHTVSGLELYKWERALAHISDTVSDARIKLQEGAYEQTYYLLQHAYDLAAQTHRRIEHIHPPDEAAVETVRPSDQDAPRSE